MNEFSSIVPKNLKEKTVFILNFIIHAIFHGSKPLLRPTLCVISKEQIVLEKKLLFVQFSFTYKDQSLINPGWCIARWNNTPMKICSSCLRR